MCIHGDFIYIINQKIRNRKANSDIKWNSSLKGVVAVVDFLDWDSNLNSYI